MLNTIQYTGKLVPVELGRRPLAGVIDLWMHRNPATGQDGDGNDIQTAEEAYMEIPMKEAPERADIEGNFDEWFSKASAWSKPTETTEESDILRRLDAVEAKSTLSEADIADLMEAAADSDYRLCLMELGITEDELSEGGEAE